MLIALNGCSRAPIVTASDAGATGRFAAEELRRYIQLISGAELPIRHEDVSGEAELGGIILRSGKGADRYWSGDRSISEEKEETFAISANDDRVCLLGQNELGLLYAVYAFLEDVLGIGFLAPGKENEWIPKSRTIRVKPLDRLERPSMRLRGYSCANQEEVDWMAKSRMNYVLDEGCEGVMDAAKLRGMKTYFAAHSFYKWLPPAEHWEAHPEYYSLVKGERVCTYQHMEHMGHQQICVTNPDVIRIVADNVTAFLDEHPEYDFCTLWPNDGGGWCECDDCLKLDHKVNGVRGNAGSYIYFANRVAERVSVKHPDKKLNIIAYNSTMPPPPDPGLSLHPNIVVEIAFWGRPCDHPVGKPISRAEIEKRMRRAKYDIDTPDGQPDEKTWALWHQYYVDYADMLKRWREIGQGDILIYDYMMASQSTLSLPYPMFGTVQGDHKFYTRIGITGCYMQAHKNNCTAYGLNYWMGAKTYWGGPQDVDQSLDEYCAKRYGSAAKPMKDYFNTIERSFRTQAGLFWPYNVSRLLTPAVVAKCEKELSAAEATVRGGQRKDWFTKTKLHFQYARLMRRFYDACIRGDKCGDAAMVEDSFPELMEVYKATLDLYEHILKLRGHDILSTPRVVLYSLLKQESKRSADTLSSVEAASNVAERLWPGLYDRTGW